MFVRDKSGCINQDQVYCNPSMIERFCQGALPVSYICPVIIDQVNDEKGAT